MMRLALVGLFALAACGGSQSQVEMKGGDADLAGIAGDWEGSYTGQESGRSGTASFHLELGRHTADGTILMGGTTPLKIQFVGIEHGQVRGTIDPYMDPSCTCQVQTEFVGTLSGDSISGSFTTTVIGKDIVQHGEWSMTRKAPAQ